jgi:hypothetical protein
MISPEKKKLLEQLPSTSYGRALFEYLEEEYKTIESVKGVKTLEQAIGKQIAIETLEKLFAVCRPTPETKKGKNQYV